MEIWQKQLGSLERWWNTQSKVNPTLVYEQMGHPVLMPQWNAILGKVPTAKSITQQFFYRILFRRHYMTTVEVTCKDKSYLWLLQWISQKGARKTQHLVCNTSKRLVIGCVSPPCGCLCLLASSHNLRQAFLTTSTNSLNFHFWGVWINKVVFSNLF